MKKHSVKLYVSIPVFIVCFIVQTTMLCRLDFFGFTPNLLLCLVVVFSFLHDGYYGLIMGVIFGSLLDISTSLYFGIQTITFVVAYIIAQILRSIFDHEKMLPDVLACAIATIANVFIVWGAYRIVGSPMYLSGALISLPVLIITQCIIAAIFHKIFVGSVIRHRGDRMIESEMFR